MRQVPLVLRQVVSGASGMVEFDLTVVGWKRAPRILR